MKPPVELPPAAVPVTPAAAPPPATAPMPAPTGPVDARPPREIAELVASIGVTKTRLPVVTALTLSVLAGAFIALGALFFLMATTQSSLGFGPTRVFGGLCFSLGLILVVVAGAELFTGNNLLAMAWASGLIDTRDVLRNWLMVFAGNALGCAGMVVLVWAADLASLGQGAFGQTALAVAIAKVQLPALEALARGVLCNALVCLAVWLTLGGHSVTDKVLGVIFPITAFVALGLEHSIANLFFLPYGMLLGGSAAVPLDGLLRNLLWVTLGNVLGGTLLVAGVYWLAYLRQPRA